MPALIIGAALSLMLGLPLAPVAMAGSPEASDDAQSTTADSGSAEDSAAIAGEVREGLDEKGTADYWVVFTDQAELTGASDAEDWVERGQRVVDGLKATAEKSQAKARQLLDDAGVDYRPFWVSNRIMVEDGDSALTTRLAALPGVERLAAPQVVPYTPPDKAALEETIQAVEWGIAAINADDVWTEFGVRGEGIVVANNDTGVQYDHPALVDSYRGTRGDGTFDHNYNWFDPSGICATADPCDWAGHGSHTMGTMAGEDGANQIGVAPAVTWMAGMGCDLPPDSCSDEALMAVGQWTLEPRDLNGENPRVDLRPHIVNNSWGGANGPEIDPWYDDVLRAWNEAGMFAVFSNGNSGPGCDTTGSPADSLLAFGVGGFQSSGAVYNSSSRGPGDQGEVRPNISAPAVSVRSSVPDDTYDNYSGTSMAAPHVAGTVALLWSAAPDLFGDVEATRDLLEETAIPTDDTSCGGTPELNNVWGHGKLDALAAMQQAPTEGTGYLSGTVTSGGQPIANASITVDGPTQRQTRTEADGTFQMIVPQGDYTVEVDAFGFEPETRSATVTDGGTTVEDFDLVASAAASLSGVVTDLDLQPVAGATVEIEDTPLAPATTDADGRYRFDDVPVGDYTATASAGQCYGSQSLEAVIVSDAVLDFQLPARTDAFGYSCGNEPSAYEEGDTLTALTGDDQALTIDLPFELELYGEFYGQAHIATNGFIGLDVSEDTYANGSIPSPAVPNASVYPLWDDLIIDAESGVYTGEYGSGDDHRFVVEHRNARFYGETNRIDISTTFYENGEIVLSWRNIDPLIPLERGGEATVGIENADGTVALQYSYNEPVLTNDESVRFTPPPRGRVSGVITDRNDGLPVELATITAYDGDTEIGSVTTGPDGSYGFVVGTSEGPVDLRLVVEAARYASAEAELTLESGDQIVQDFDLATGRAELEAPDTTVVLPAGYDRTIPVWLMNTGSADLTYEALDGAGFSGTGESVASDTGLAAKVQRQDPDAFDTSGMYPKDAAAKVESGVEPLAPGDVLASWQSGLEPAWGVGFDGDVWLSDPAAVTNTEFDRDGERTGVAWPAGWAGTWNADMANDTRRGLMCQVNVGGDNGIHCWDPQTGEVGYSLTGSPWSGTSQRGLAYRPDNDTFYIAGWNQDVLYHVAGQSHDNPGATLNSCAVPTGASGLAWQAESGTVWMATNSPTDDILRLNPETCDVVDMIADPESDTEYSGAGLAQDEFGDLWTTSQLTNRAFLLDSGMRVETNVPWLDITPASGTLAPGDEQELAVTVDTTGLDPGVYNARVVIRSDAGRRPFAEVPVRLVVPAYWTGVDAGATSGSTDVLGLPWVADRRYQAGRAGAYGWVGAESFTGVPLPDRVNIRGTQDDSLYRTSRHAMEAYRFDDLPGGAYEVTLDFAERAKKPRVDWRKFDVDIDGEWVLVGYDIARTAGGRTADRYTFTVTVPDGGDLSVNFHDRRSYREPLVNAVRVVHRPDL